MIDAYPTVREGRKKDYSDVIFMCLKIGDLFLHEHLKKLSSSATNQTTNLKDAYEMDEKCVKTDWALKY